MTKDADRLERPHEGPWYYEMQELGFNYRIPDIGCALAVSQLSKLDRFVQRRRADRGAIPSTPGATFPAVQLPPAEQLDNSAWHLFCLHIDFAELGVSREQIIQEFHARGIGTQVHYYPVPLQPFYRRRYGYAPEQFPGACRHYERALSVPLYPAMTDADMNACHFHRKACPGLRVEQLAQGGVSRERASPVEFAWSLGRSAFRLQSP